MMLKAAQKELIESELRYRRLFNTAHDGILIVDFTTSLIIDVNPFLLEFLGYSREEILGNPLWDFGRFKDRELSKNAFLTLKEKHYIRYEDLPLETKGGIAKAVEIVSNVYGEGDRKVIQCNIRDISERKQAERTAQQLLQSRQLEAIGQLAGGVAHDFNNLLQIILGYGELLVDSPNLNEAERRALAEMYEAGKSAKNLTHRLLAFSSRQILEPVFMDLNEAVKEANAMLAGLIGDDIEMKMILGSNLDAVKVDPNQIQQVLMNLAINARDAMPKGGKITFQTANVKVDETYAQQHLFIKPGQYVLLSVSDTGIGIKLGKRRQWPRWLSSAPENAWNLTRQVERIVALKETLSRGRICDPVNLLSDTAPMKGVQPCGFRNLFKQRQLHLRQCGYC
jgi:PAS domain S-box-containing protein